MRRAPLVNLVGFGLTTALLAVASIASIPAMVATSGPGAWGAIALGQASGALAALVVGYGWAVTGPPKIAQSDTGERLNEYADATKVKLVLFVPCAAAASLIAVAISPRYPLFTSTGAVSATAVAFSGGWFFAGLSRPFMLLLLETVPRVLWTGIGVVLMRSGRSAITGLACNMTGILLAFALVTAWVYRSCGSHGVRRLRTHSTRELLTTRRHGITVMLGAQMFFSVPLAVISTVSPANQPLFALADKFRQLISAGLSPLVMMFQGWVPQPDSASVRRRGQTALGYAAVIGVAVVVAVLALGGRLMHWLGHGEIPSDRHTVVATALIIALDLFNSVLVFGFIAALGRLEIVTRAVRISFMVMLPLAILGARTFGSAGVLASIFAGLLVRVVLELSAVNPGRHPNRRPAAR